MRLRTIKKKIKNFLNKIKNGLKNNVGWIITGTGVVLLIGGIALLALTGPFGFIALIGGWVMILGGGIIQGEIYDRKRRNDHAEYRLSIEKIGENDELNILYLENQPHPMNEAVSSIETLAVEKNLIKEKKPTIKMRARNHFNLFRDPIVLEVEEELPKQNVARR